jgi:outer membrane protein assembly factor BamD (BamD/ComL family)
VALAAETALLERARAALSRGWTDSALEALDQHRTRFPKGELAEEREALSVLALDRAGRTEEAQRRAEEFSKAFPSSLWRDQVEGAQHRQ